MPEMYVIFWLPDNIFCVYLSTERSARCFRCFEVFLNDMGSMRFFDKRFSLRWMSAIFRCSFHARCMVLTSYRMSQSLF